MNFKKTKVTVASGLMAASMVLAPLAAYAKDNNGDATTGYNSIDIVKTVKVADGVTIKGDVTFQLEQINESTGGNANVTAPNKTTNGFTEIEGIKFINGRNETKATYADGKYTGVASTNGKTQASDNAEGAAADNQYKATVGLDFSNAHVNGKTKLENGLYTFKLTEIETDGVKYQNKGVDQNNVDYAYGWSDVDRTEYTLRVYVTNNGETIKYMIAESGGAKTDEADFTDTYTARGNSVSGGASLVINKTVPDKTYLVNGTKFKFKVNFTGVKNSDDSDLVAVPSTLKATIYKTGTDEKVGGDETLEVEDGSVAFELEEGQEIRFADIPAGIKYTVTESAFANDGGTKYITTASNMTTGWKDAGQSKMTAEDAVISDGVANGTGFENTLKTITVTGVVTHSAPFVIMVGALFVAVGGYVVLKKRIEE